MRRWAPQEDEVPHEQAGMESIGNVVVQVVDKIGLAAHIAQYTESPIETILGVEIMFAFKWRGKRLIFSTQEAMAKIGDGELIFVPQFKWRRYRADWAICVGQKPEAFIECDGREFHSSDEQQERDFRRDKEISEAGIIALRFSGSDIHSNTEFCVQQIMDRVLGVAWRRRL